ncbi:MAG TPA: SGNH hydrolase domain-containing protein [Vicinamibacterales bacterium]|nr:SGNH hydrolase domain-containing protein [Vicinamibacterales bacterium]
MNRSAAIGDGVFAVERHAAAAFPRVAVLDLTDAFCGADTCSPVLNGTVVYRDTNHMTSAFSAGLAPSLGRALDAVDRRGS